MSPHSETPPREELDSTTRFLHLGLTVFGVLAWLTGYFAGDYKYPGHTGFGIHKWLGLGLAFFLTLRILYGFYGPKPVRFSEWVPYTRDRLLLVLEDLGTLLKFQLPDRPPHLGLSGLVQTYGLLAFSWSGLTGALMFFFLHPGRKAGSLMHFIKEIHEFGAWLIPIFLAFHAGAVTLHALTGNHLWKRTFFLEP